VKPEARKPATLCFYLFGKFWVLCLARTRPTRVSHPIFIITSIFLIFIKKSLSTRISDKLTLAELSHLITTTKIESIVPWKLKQEKTWTACVYKDIQGQEIFSSFAILFYWEFCHVDHGERLESSASAYLKFSSEFDANRECIQINYSEM